MIEIKKLRDVATIFDSLHQTPKYNNNAEHKIIRVVDIKEGPLPLDNALCVEYDTFKQYTRKHTPQKGDIIISRVGSYGICSYVNTDQNFCLGQNLALIHPHINSKYLYYCLISPFVKQQIESVVVGTTQKTLSLFNISNLNIKVPTEIEQKAIADVLSSFDDKIELNNKIIKNLEERSQSLYKHWFVDFEFPNEEGKPYKSSGGKFKESELGLIPESWMFSPLANFVKKNNKKFNNMHEWENLDVIDLSVMPQFSINISEFSKGSDFTTNIYKLEEYDLLFGSIRSYFGKAGFSPICGGVTGTVHSFKPINKDYYSFLLESITNKGFIEKTVKLSSGTKMPIINWDTFSNIALVVSKDGIIERKFNDVIKHNIEKIKTIILENKKLEETRDYLLQKLMSGEIKVNEIK